MFRHGLCPLELFLPVRCTFSHVQNRLSESNVFAYLRGVGLLTQGEEARVEEAGEGNINWVRRVRGQAAGSFVLKQARPALERFPEYTVSTERIIFEARYYELTERFDQDGVRPRVLHFDPVERILVLEDLGHAERLDHALARGGDVAPALGLLAGFLGAVHAGTRNPDLAARFANDDMRRLHGEHIFVLPYRENDFPLPAGLRESAREIWCDHTLVNAIGAAHARYLEPLGALVHGDVQPSNVLLDGQRPVLLDAEIAHVGDPAFDVGTLLAHVLLADCARPGAQAGRLITGIWSAYSASHPDGAPSFADAARYAGIEMLRRTIGAARVAAVADESAALRAIALGRSLTTRPPDGPRTLAAPR